MADQPVVLDTSLTLAWCFPDERRDETEAMRRRVQANGAVVPEHWQAEVENTVRIGEIRGRLTREDVSKFIEVIRAQQIEVDRQPVPQTFGELLPLSRQHRITVYDAAYVELAKRRGLQLATLDEAMLRAARALGVEVL